MLRTAVLRRLVRHGTAAAYTPVIGVECHVQLNTATKAFCRCTHNAHAAPNTHVCGVCLGEPGTLPVHARDAPVLGLKAAVALDCAELADRLEWDRKNYSYPDLPKGYQITQLRKPLAKRGRVAIDGKTIRITSLHLEEDSAKTGECIDHNRAGVALAEVVTEPDLTSGAEAASFVRELQQIMRRCGASDARLEHGELRVDVNVSVTRAGEVRERVELKNLNSLRAVRLACDFELQRQAKVYAGGGAVTRDTRAWDGRATYVLREKGGASEYRFAPEPDLPPRPLAVELAGLNYAEILATTPRAARLQCVAVGVDATTAGRLVEKDVDAFFLETVRRGAPTAAAQWLLGEVAAVTADLPPCFRPQDLADLLRAVEDGALSRRSAKELLPGLMAAHAGVAEEIKKRGLARVDDASVIDDIVRATLAESPEEVELFKEGRMKLRKVLMGRCMAKAKGRADPRRLGAALDAALA